MSRLIDRNTARGPVNPQDELLHLRDRVALVESRLRRLLGSPEPVEAGQYVVVVFRQGPNPRNTDALRPYPEVTTYPQSIAGPFPTRRAAAAWAASEGTARWRGQQYDIVPFETVGGEEL
jgi:hypothetical protein